MTKMFFCLALALIVCTAAIAQDHPKAEVFLGYNYLRMNSATNVPAFSANGGSGQFVLNFGKWFGFVSDLGAVHNGNVGGYHLDTTLTNFLFGPRIPVRVSQRVTPYFQTLFGGVYGSTSAGIDVSPPQVTNPIVPPVAPTTSGNAVHLRAGASQTAFAMTAGGGLDIKINRHVSFRPVQLEYMLTRLQNLRSANDNNQNNLRYATGLNFTFGGEAPAPPPPPPPPRTCWNGTTVPYNEACPKREMNLRLSASQAELCPGNMVTLTPGGDVPSGAALDWTVNGQPTSKAATFEFGTTGRDPGTYNIALVASAAEYNDALARTTITVLPYRAPGVSLQASPSEIWVGDQANLTSNVTPGQCGGSLRQPVISASEGAIAGNRFDSSGVQFDPSDNNEQRKTVRLQARVADDKGAATADATVVVKRKAVIMAKRLPDIVFPNNSARVNNCGKRVLLEELKALIDRDPSGKVVFVGHVTGSEKTAGLDRMRALNSAAVISAGQGICSSFPASQIQVSEVGSTDNGVDLQPHFCGTSATPKTGELSGQTVKESDGLAKFRRVEVWFVPTGGTLPASVKESQEATALAVTSLGCPK